MKIKTRPSTMTLYEKCEKIDIESFISYSRNKIDFSNNKIKYYEST